VDKKRKYVPSIIVRSDDLIVTDEEGNEHKPHEGEKVIFRKGVSLGTIRKMAEAGRLVELGTQNVTPEVAREIEEILAGMIEALAHQILDWTWTDEDWEPLPKPKDRAAFLAALGGLDDYEMAWLQAHYADGAKVSPN